MKDRIAKIIKKERLTSQQFAEIVEIQSSTISHILAGRNLPSCKIITNILEKFPNISPDWLLLGNGEMYRGAEKYPISEPIPLIEPQFSEFTNVTTPEPVAEDEEGLNISSNEDNTPIIEPNNSNKTTIDCVAVPQKLIVMYSDKTFEIFHTK